MSSRRSLLWPPTLAVLLAAVTLGLWMAWRGYDPDVTNTVLFIGWGSALLLVFLAGLRLPLQPRLGRRTRPVYTTLVVLGTLAVTGVANVAVSRHDVHFDLTREKLSTPAPQAETLVRSLAQDVRVTYFYQAQDGNGRRAKELLEILGRRNPHLRVRTVDPDRDPRIADQYGVRLYNAAVLEADGRRVQVQSTDETEIVLGILRVLRQQVRTVCFLEGHGEYAIDNFEYHTHFETLQSHSHSGEGSNVVLSERHGAGRLRRALEALGYDVRKIILGALPEIPADCAAIVDVNPRTTYLPGESDLLEQYMTRGGGVLLMYDLGFTLEPRLATLLARLGIRLEQDVVVDPLDHYATDQETLAVPVYQRHPITDRIALTFFPGARPITPLPPAPGITVSPLFSSSPDSYTRPVKPAAERQPAPGVRAPTPDESRRAARILAVAAEGAWTDTPGSRPFRAVVVGDSDFTSNSFFPYMANSDLALSMLRWVLREDRSPAVRPRIPVLPMVTLTNRQMRAIFLLVDILLPLGVVAVGVVEWWRRR